MMNIINVVIIFVLWFWSRIRCYLCSFLGHRFWSKIPEGIITLDHCNYCNKQAEFAKRRLRDT